LSKTIDARGKSCPEPVVMTKRALESLEEGIITVVVDNPTSRDNVERFAKSQGCSVDVQERGGDYLLDIVKGYPCEVRLQGRGRETPTPSFTPKVVVYVSSDIMGGGDTELGGILLRAFVKTLKDVTPRPQKLIFVNSGVRLTTGDSDLIESIRELESMGVEVLSCGTCLDYFRLKDRLRVGLISNMFDIATSLLEADSVVRP